MEDLNITLTNHSNSSIYSYCKYREPNTDLEKIAKRTVFALMIVLGIFGNVFVIILAAKYTVRKNLHHLIINMAVSDALYLITFLIQRIPRLSDYKWSIYPKNTFGDILCHILALSGIDSYRVSLMTLLVISIERFRATRRVLKISQPYTFKKRMIVLGICWLIPTPSSAYWAYVRCNKSRIDQQITSTISIIEFCSLVIVCCVVFVLSIITIRRLSRPQAIQDHLNQQQRNARKKRTQSAVQMVLVSVLLYTCCWVPIYVFYVLLHVDVVSPAVDIIDYTSCIDWSSIWYIVHTFLPVINSCVSPLIYIIFLPDFRQAAKNVLCRREIQNPEPNRRQSIELQPIPLRPLVAPNRRRRHSDNEQEL